MRLITYLLLVMFLSVEGGIATVGAEESARVGCPAILSQVGPVSGRNQVLICKAADQARAFFLSHDIEVQRPISIRVHEEEIENHADHIGLYDARENIIDMVTLTHCRGLCSERPPFGIPMTEAMYASFVIHEIAHAIVDQNFTGSSSSLIVQEYLAYVAQFSQMEPDLRSRILGKYSVSAFTGIEDMSLTYYELDPNAFGVKAFLHYRSLADKSSFIRGLLSGDIRQRTEHVEW